jgi:hypothetical protein
LIRPPSSSQKILTIPMFLYFAKEKAKVSWMIIIVLPLIPDIYHSYIYLHPRFGGPVHRQESRLSLMNASLKIKRFLSL